jgi:serine/threonine protein kinase
MDADGPGEARSAAASNVSTAGAAVRYGFPYPLAALFRKQDVSHDPAVRYGYAMRFVEGCFHLLAVLSIVDAVSAGAPASKVKRWLETLARPGMGRFLNVAASACGLAPSGDARPLIPPGLLDDASWRAAVGVLKDGPSGRNEFAHRRLLLEEAEARARLVAVGPALADLAGSLRFLERLRLGVARRVKPAGRGCFSVQWSDLRGPHEEGRLVQFKVDTALPEGVPILLDPAGDRAFPLAPFFAWRQERGMFRFRWLVGLGAEGASVLGRYGHPILRGDHDHPLADPWDPDCEGRSLAEWAQHAAEWHSPVSLGLSEHDRGLLSIGTDTLSRDKRYDVVGRLGSGATGTVWEVRNRVLDRPAALKVLRRELLESEVQVRRFVQEARVLAGLDHPRVVSVHSVDELEDGRPCIEMQLLRGETIAERLDARGTFDDDEVRTILDQVLEGLEAVHAAGVVHRDVKPANVVLTDTGAVLLDFGIAKSADITSANTISVMGTLPYLAPEQAAGQPEPRSDLYSVGRLLFTMLTGTPPTPMERPDLGREGWLEIVYHRSTEPRAVDRYGSASEMRMALSTRDVPPSNRGAGGADPGDNDHFFVGSAKATFEGGRPRDEDGEGTGRRLSFPGSHTTSGAQVGGDDPQSPRQNDVHGTGARVFQPLATLIEAADPELLQQRLMLRPGILRALLGCSGAAEVRVFHGDASLVVLDKRSGNASAVVLGPTNSTALPSAQKAAARLRKLEEWLASNQRWTFGPESAQIVFLLGRRSDHDDAFDAARAALTEEFRDRVHVASYDRLLDALEGHSAR